MKNEKAKTKNGIKASLSDSFVFRRERLLPKRNRKRPTKIGKITQYLIVK